MLKSTDGTLPVSMNDKLISIILKLRQILFCAEFMAEWQIVVDWQNWAASPTNFEKS